MDNIIKSLKMIKAFEIAYIHYDVMVENDSFKRYELIQQIIKTKADKVFFIDHFPVPLELVSHLGKNYEYYFYIYGNYTLHLDTWNKLHEKCQNWNFSYIVASSAEKKLLKSLSNIEASVIPFPVDFNEFNREKINSQIELPEEYILYTGRISPSKNIDKIIRAFKRYRDNDISSQVKLIIAGEFDDLKNIFKAKSTDEGENFYRIYYQLRHEIGEDFFDNEIKFLGSIENAKLISIYQNARLFISLSVYNDEDYGMSVAEALACGCPILLSGWGGYHDFSKLDSNSSLQQVRLSEVDHKIDLDQVALNMAKRLSEDDDRELINQNAFDYFSLETVSKKIEAHLLQQMMKNNIRFDITSKDIRSSNNKFTKKYKEIYQAYV